MLPRRRFGARGAFLRRSVFAMVSAVSLTGRHFCVPLRQAALAPWYEKSPAAGPLHVGWAWKRYNYDNYVGGIFTISAEHVKQMNGYPNNFWGWGGEDDEFGARLVKARIPKYRRPPDALFNTIRDLEEEITKETGVPCLALPCLAVRFCTAFA